MNINWHVFGGALLAISSAAVSNAANIDDVVDENSAGASSSLEKMTSADATVEVTAKMLGRIANITEYKRMQDYVQSLVDPSTVVYSFVTGAGDEVDCVDIYEQPALKQPGMEGHVIGTPPPLSKPVGAVKKGDNPASVYEATQEGPLLGESCPEGAVPIRRLTMDIMRNFRSLEDFRKKVPSHIQPPRTGASSLHQYAHAYRSVSNLGAQSSLNLWEPYTELSKEFSLSQIWVARGSGSNLETVEAGWQKYKDLYGDWRSRLFIYFTPDNYGSGGCYNLTCGAFVQTDPSVIIGGAFSNYSTVNGTQYEVMLRWHKGGSNNAWWLLVGNKWAGYYPREKFDAYGLRDNAATIDFGGEIIDSRPGGRHTSTDMGSGYFPARGFGYAAFQRGLKYIDTSNYLVNATGLTPTRTDFYCYDIALKFSWDAAWGNYFYFGGSGYNTDCQ